METEFMIHTESMDDEKEIMGTNCVNEEELLIELYLESWNARKNISPKGVAKTIHYFFLLEYLCGILQYMEGTLLRSQP